MKFSKFMLILVIISIAIIALVLGITYAYYTSTGGVSTSITTSNEDPSLAVVFSQSEFINFNVGIPIPDNKIAEQSSKSVFTIVPDSTKLANKAVVVNISLVNISIADELKIADFKYDLICNDGSTNTTLTSGDGTDFTAQVLSDSVLPLGTLSTSNNTFNATKTYTCTFRLWLHETNSDQNSLMGKNFNGVLKVGTAYK